MTPGAVSEHAKWRALNPSRLTLKGIPWQVPLSQLLWYMGSPILRVDELLLKKAHVMAQHVPRAAPLVPK